MKNDVRVPSRGSVRRRLAKLHRSGPTLAAARWQAVTQAGHGCLGLQCNFRVYTSPRLSTSTPDQDFHLDHEPPTIVGHTKAVPNLVTHAALNARR